MARYLLQDGGNFRIPQGVDMDHENEKWYVRDGIVVIPKNAEIESGTVISPQYETGLLPAP